MTCCQLLIDTVDGIGNLAEKDKGKVDDNNDVGILTVFGAEYAICL